jgi:hypothetical protein
MISRELSILSPKIFVLGVHGAMKANYAFKRTAGTVHVFPAVLSARGRLTRRWVAGEACRSILLAALSVEIAQQALGARSSA